MTTVTLQNMSKNINAATWLIKKWHPRKLLDAKVAPDPDTVPETDAEINAENGQWFTSILPCTKFEQFVYAHLDTQPYGMWVIDIHGPDDSGKKQIVRTYATTLSLLYVNADIPIDSDLLILHYFRADPKTELPNSCVAGFLKRIEE